MNMTSPITFPDIMLSQIGSPSLANTNLTPSTEFGTDLHRANATSFTSPNSVVTTLNNGIPNHGDRDSQQLQGILSSANGYVSNHLGRPMKDERIPQLQTEVAKDQQDYSIVTSSFSSGGTKDSNSETHLTMESAESKG